MADNHFDPRQGGLVVAVTTPLWPNGGEILGVLGDWTSVSDWLRMGYSLPELLSHLELEFSKQGTDFRVYIVGRETLADAGFFEIPSEWHEIACDRVVH